MLSSTSARESPDLNYFDSMNTPSHVPERVSMDDGSSNSSLKLSNLGSDCSSSVTSTGKCRKRQMSYWKYRKDLKKNVVDSIITDSIDKRPYVDVEIQGKIMRGLLDSGANICVLGAGCEKLIEENTLKFRNLPCSLSTANGEKVRIFGHIRVQVKFNNKKRYMTFHLAPNLKQQLYLGTDFWDKFNIKPIIVDEIDGNVSFEVDSNRHELTLKQKEILESVIKLFPSSEIKGLGKTSLLMHEIDVGSAKPIKQRYYPVSPIIQADLDKEIDRMLKLGVIEISKSSWSSPVSLVRKSNGKVRMCLDARKLNEVTVKDSYPLPNIEGLLGRLDKTRYISSIDLKDAFWQIPLHPASRDKTAFTVPDRPLFQFTVLPFGLCNSPQTMCRLMHLVIPHELHDRVFVYLDDLLITSATFDEHIALLEHVAGLLTAAELTINVEKSKFLLKQIKYLGYIVGDGCLKVNPEKVQAISEFPRPKTSRQIRRFQGMTGWFSRFIKDYSIIMAPLTELLKKNCKHSWNEKTEAAFQQMKLALTTAPVLVNPDFSKPFFVQCDACTSGVGGVLFQISDDGHEHPIAFVSKKLNGAQKNYTTTELECYAVIVSIKKFRPYIEGYNFTVITDHASLRWLMNQKDLSGRLARWSLKLQGYSFNIEHRKGTQNIVPDTLSRMYASEEICLEIEEISNCHLDLDSSEFEDPDYLEMLKSLRENPLSITNMRELNGKLLIAPSFGYNYEDTDVSKWKLYIPKQLVPKIISRAHDPPNASHVGIAKTLNLIRRNFYWPFMARDVKNYVKNCQTCKTTKSPTFATRPLMGSLRPCNRPFQRLFIDFLGPYPATKLGNTYIFIAVDHFSRFVFIEPLRQATAHNVIKILDKIFNMFSVPESVWSDNGKQFIAKVFKEFLEKHGVKFELNPKYSPQANLSERVNRSLLAAIRAYIKEDHKEWDVHLQSIACALRNVIHDATKFSPFYMVFGSHMITHGSDYQLLHLLQDDSQVMISKADRLNIAQEFVLKNLKDAYDKNCKTYNLRSKNRSFDIGQEVLVRNFVNSDAGKRFVAKFAQKFIKAKIVKAVGNVSFEVADKNGKSMGIYHIKDIIA